MRIRHTTREECRERSCRKGRARLFPSLAGVTASLPEGRGFLLSDIGPSCERIPSDGEPCVQLFTLRSRNRVARVTGKHPLTQSAIPLGHEAVREPHSEQDWCGLLASHHASS